MSKKLLLMDGSMSCQLYLFGYNTNEHKPHWTFAANNDLDLMEKVYQSFLSLNVDIITTNTYHFGSTMNRNMSETSNQNKINITQFINTCNQLDFLVKKSNRTNCQVWGSVGTFATFYHDMSEYNGKYMDYLNSDKKAEEYYREILNIFMNKTKIHSLIFETISSEAEAQSAVKVLQEFPHLNAVMSFTFNKNARLRHGENIDKIAEQLSKISQIDGFGINCTDPENVLPVLVKLEKYNFRQIIVCPNSGDSTFLSVDCNDKKCCFSKELVLNWAIHGATAIGGCCGVDIEQFQELKNVLTEINVMSS